MLHGTAERKTTWAEVLYPSVGSLPRIRFHELRHSCASMLIAMGWTLKDVQEWLGHSDIQMTANIYSHLDVGRKASIAAALTEKFGG